MKILSFAPLSEIHPRKKMIMKTRILSGILLLFFFSNCSQQESKNPSQTPPPQESTLAGLTNDQKIEKINAYLDSLNRVEDFAVQKFNLNFYSDKDKAFLRTKNGEKISLVTTTYPPNEETRDFYAFKDGQLINYKHREWFKQDNPRAKEINCYMDERGIFHVLERSIQLSAGQNPSPVLSLPYTESTLNKDSLLNIIQADLKRIETVGASPK